MLNNFDYTVISITALVGIVKALGLANFSWWWMAAPACIWYGFVILLFIFLHFMIKLFERFGL